MMSGRQLWTVYDVSKPKATNHKTAHWRKWSSKSLCMLLRPCWIRKNRQNPIRLDFFFSTIMLHISKGTNILSHAWRVAFLLGKNVFDTGDSFENDIFNTTSFFFLRSFWPGKLSGREASPKRNKFTTISRKAVIFYDLRNILFLI